MYKSPKPWTTSIPSHTDFLLGELTTARGHLEQGRSLYTPQQYPAHVMRSGQDPGVRCLAYGALTLWLLGYPDQAMQRAKEALSLAQALGHLFSLGDVQLRTAQLHHCRREGAQVAALAASAMTLAQVQGFRQMVMESAILQSWALAVQGQGEGDAAQMRQEVEAWQAMGAGHVRPYWQAVLAEMHGSRGQVEVGLALLADVLATGQTQHFYAAEIYRLQGELLLRLGVQQAGRHEGAVHRDIREPEQCFLHALEVARQQQAKSLELRAALSLGRLWQAQGQHNAARTLLAEVYEWFTEGFDTADLREARAWLDANSPT